jgi:hypothetical protein
MPHAPSGDARKRKRKRDLDADDNRIGNPLPGGP